MAMTVDARFASTCERGGRLIETDRPSTDFQPEYSVIVSNDFAMVTLQENNALAVVDLVEKQISEIRPLGYKDHSKLGNGIDSSDMDDRINIALYRGLYGMYQPDGIASFRSPMDDKQDLIIANEGDSTDEEEIHAADLTTDLERRVPKFIEDMLGDDKLGRLLITKNMGYNNVTNRQSALFSFGARSFAILEVLGTKMVYESGELLERIVEAHFPRAFNGQSEEDETIEDTFDGRQQGTRTRDCRNLRAWWSGVCSGYLGETECHLHF
mmetsp:Transcript_8589/g.17398  ORF Transcript_8589/g.17398 Transcript_8589/m.17398 type:complete len:269 (+) Transcript_8589:937-1743(+)